MPPRAVRLALVAAALALPAAGLVAAAAAEPGHAVVTCTVDGTVVTGTLVSGTAGHEAIVCPGAVGDTVIDEQSAATAPPVDGDAGNGVLHVGTHQGAVDPCTGHRGAPALRCAP
ncbi:hypothetical protein BLA24_14300 [Streptomyces cinnamoneus]|uniref:DUF320 domain-containing protein n=1 Tax=Streptomyces cinnamoneus TaxID=53446 RepID=A0A2G1XI83_STRCJ|nr:hypothetical protein BLA24_14300 [Streptomyces cinnamoneus]PPT13816.1 hypothetical protein CYQ11_13775 [Streptomyces cinnamoneus]